MAATLITAYLGEDLAANRPVTPLIATGTIGLFYAKDTAMLSAYLNGVWYTISAAIAGTLPVIVQSKASVAGTQSVVMDGAPTSGNLLIAMCFNPSVDTAGSGWTKGPGEVTTGTDFGVLFTKTAGGGESTTQSPLNSSPGGTGAIVIWELSGAATGVIAATAQAEQTGLNAASPQYPVLTNCLFLAACALVSTSNNINNLYNLTQDQAIKTGTTRQIIAGHSSPATVAMGQLLATFTGAGTPSYKCMVALVSS